MGALEGFVQALADGAALLRRVAVRSLRPDPELLLSEWAAQHRTLTSKTSGEAGPWRNERTPYLVEIMDALSPADPCEEVVLMKGTQIGGTEVGNNWIGGVIHQWPAPMLAIQPTLDLAKRLSTQRLAPMFRTPVLAERIAPERARDSTNTLLMKDFDGGVLIIAGANSAVALRSAPCRYVFADEIDGYPFDVDGEGDPLALAAKRQTNFYGRKRFLTSTPTTKGFSRIEQAFERTDQRYYNLPCPHCDELQRLRWANVRWIREPVDLPETAHCVCEHCGGEIHEHHKTEMLARGRWIPTAPGDGRAKGYHLSTLYSPLGWESWASLVRQFLEAKRALDAGDDTKMKTFVNTCLAETWEEDGDKVEHNALQARAEHYALRSVPLGGLTLTASIDVQSNRLVYLVKAWGRFEESWSVDYGVLWGDPAQLVGGVWDEAHRIITTALPHAAGGELRIMATAIDSGGHHTHEVYQFARKHRALNVFAVKGHAHPGRPVLGTPNKVDVNARGEKLKRGVQLWLIGTDTAKALIYGRLRTVTEPGPGCMHFSHELPGEYYEELTAERLATRYVKGRPRLEWIKPAGKRNEALDLEVYALAAAHKLQLHRFRVSDWDALERRVQPQQPDLLAAPAPAAAAAPRADPFAAIARAPRLKTGFVKGWR